MFEKIMAYIKNFLENTPDDIYDFSCELEGLLIVNYDVMHAEQSRATEVLNDETPDICALGEPGMKREEIDEFKRKLKIEYDKTLKAIVYLNDSPKMVHRSTKFCKRNKRQYNKYQRSRGLVWTGTNF